MIPQLLTKIDCTQNVVLPAKTMLYRNVWGLDVSVTVMDVKEICAEKLRAMSDRSRFRDFFDFSSLMEQYHFDLTEVFDLLRQKEKRN